VTVDEELTKLEEDLRRLKVEYEVYFNGSTDRPPRDLVYRVENLIKRYTGDQANLNFGQRYKLNALAQKYGVQNSLWKRRLIEKEEGRGHFAQQKRELEALMAGETVRIVCSDPEGEPEKVDQIFKAIISAQRKVGRKVENVDPARFQKYLCHKTKQIKALLGCAKVQFSVSTEQGKVKFTAVKA
jgi:hypothetical protein